MPTIKIKRIPAVRALTFRRTFDPEDGDAIDYFGGLTNKAIRKAGVVPTGRPSGRFDPTEDGMLRVTYITPVDDAPSTVPLDGSDYLVEEGDSLRLETVAGTERAASVRVEAGVDEAPTHLAALDAWATDRGYRLEPGHRITILRGSMDVLPDGRRVYPHEWIWELQRAIETG